MDTTTSTNRSNDDEAFTNAFRDASDEIAAANAVVGPVRPPFLELEMSACGTNRVWVSLLARRIGEDEAIRYAVEVDSGKAPCDTPHPALRKPDATCGVPKDTAAPEDARQYWLMGRTRQAGYQTCTAPDGGVYQICHDPL
ncbi:MAG: hypothetical protein IIZ92_10125 [Aquincola sp.]|nr:hypothetical protein [Aquincola sp.]